VVPIIEKSFFLNNGSCSVVVQKLTCIDYSLTSAFSSYKYVAAIKHFVDNVYIVVKRMESSLVETNHADICSISSLRSRCFSVPFGDEFLIITSYSCAYEHD